MHERFVVANGGKVPNPEEIQPGKVSSFERVQKESTFAITKQFLKEKKSIAAIVKERGMVESTIWGHIEKLVTDGGIELADILHLEPAEGWPTIRFEIDAAIESHGTERLKALYEATGEAYDYNLIRLARIEYLLERKRGESVF
jgi:hypothetical protein